MALKEGQACAGRSCYCPWFSAAVKSRSHLFPVRYPTRPATLRVHPLLLLL